MITLFRLVTGIEIITDVKENGDWEHPMFLNSQPGTEGKAEVTLSPLLHFADKSTCKPQKEHVFIEYHPIASVRDLYSQTTTAYRMQKTGIIHPTQANMGDLKSKASNIESRIQ